MVFGVTYEHQGLLHHLEFHLFFANPKNYTFPSISLKFYKYVYAYF